VRLAANRDDETIGLRVLDLNPMPRADDIGNQVIVAVLAVRECEAASPISEIGGDLELSEVSLPLQRRHGRDRRQKRIAGDAQEVSNGQPPGE